MPLFKTKILPRSVWNFLMEYFSNIFVAMEMLFVKISVLTGKNAGEVFWKTDIPALEMFMFAFQKSVTNNNCYESNVHLMYKIVYYSTYREGYWTEYSSDLVNWNIHSADISQHTNNNWNYISQPVTMLQFLRIIKIKISVIMWKVWLSSQAAEVVVTSQPGIVCNLQTEAHL